MLFDDETETEYQSLAGKQRQERWNRFWRAAERNDDIVYLLQDPEDDGILAIKSEDFGIIPIWSDATLARLYTTDESYQVQGFTLDELRESILPQLIEDDLACALDVEGEVAEEDLFDPAMVRRAIV